jgi:hypothetical protein
MCDERVALNKCNLLLPVKLYKQTNKFRRGIKAKLLNTKGNKMKWGMLWTQLFLQLVKMTSCDWSNFSFTWGHHWHHVYDAPIITCHLCSCEIFVSLDRKKKMYLISFIAPVVLAESQSMGKLQRTSKSHYWIEIDMSEGKTSSLRS